MYKLPLIKTVILLAICHSICLPAIAQDEKTDTLERIVVNAFQNNRQLLYLAAAVNVLGKAELERSGSVSIVPSMNMLPGVNMDERSPGSYRLNFRGSSVRSPFGVRNVKVYYNDIPFTDPGGNTYLQILGFYNYDDVEILKGPSGSMYGSGTGGVMFIRDAVEPNVQEVAYALGSNGSQSMMAAANIADSSSSFSIKYNRQAGDGYRNHTAMHRDVVTLGVAMSRGEHQKISAHFLYGNLYYQTPGALTLAEYQADPRSSRPAAGIFPSAEEARASFTLDYFLAGFTLQQKVSNEINNKTTVYGAYAQNRNPNFRNFSRTSEPHFGTRTNFSFAKNLDATELTLNAGGEFQHSFYAQRVFKNHSGSTGELQTDDEVHNTQALAYLQAQLNWKNGFSLLAGTSVNVFSVDFTRFSGSGLHYRRTFKNQWAPRLSAMQVFRKNFVVYTSVSKGFSPPSTGELLPSTDIFNQTLQAERGMNFEIGGRASLMQRRLFVDVSLFRMKVDHIIIQKRDASGGDYFENAGSADEFGAEAMVRYHVLRQPGTFFEDILVNMTSTLYDFRFKNYKPLNNDYSGNRLPGVSPVKITGSVDAKMRFGLFWTVTSIYNSGIPLNDANSAIAQPYLVMGSQISKATHAGSLRFTIAAGVQNLFDETYSLGNDINAAGGRYYNAAPGRQFYLSMQLTRKGK